MYSGSHYVKIGIRSLSSPTGVHWTDESQRGGAADLRSENYHLQGNPGDVLGASRPYDVLPARWRPRITVPKRDLLLL